MKAIALSAVLRDRVLGVAIALSAVLRDRVLGVLTQQERSPLKA